MMEMRRKFERNEDTDIEIKYGKNLEHSKKAHLCVLVSTSQLFSNALEKHEFKVSDGMDEMNASTNSDQEKTESSDDFGSGGRGQGGC